MSRAAVLTNRCRKPVSDHFPIRAGSTSLSAKSPEMKIATVPFYCRVLDCRSQMLRRAVNRKGRKSIERDYPITLTTSYIRKLSVVAA
jgi:hypothetical protein